MKYLPKYKDGDWTVYPGKVTLKIISGEGVKPESTNYIVPEPKKHHDNNIRWRRIVLFLAIMVFSIITIKWFDII